MAGRAHRGTGRNRALEDENKGLRSALTEAYGVSAELRARIEELEKKKTPPPSCVKPNRPKKADLAGREQRVRAAAHNHGRRRGTPTRVERHAYEACPDCG